MITGRSLLYRKVWLQDGLGKRYNSGVAIKTGFWVGVSSLFNDGVKTAQGLIEGMHVLSGLPWWSCIVAASLASRLLLLPLRLHAARQTALLLAARSDAALQLSQRRALLSKQSADKADEKTFVNEAYRRAMQERGTSPFGSILPGLLHLPLLLLMTAALRRMSAVPWLGSGDADQCGEMVTGWSQGGLPLFSDLSLPSWPLTAIVSLSNAFSIYYLMHPRRIGLEKETSSRLRWGIYWMTHGFNLLGTAILAMMPSAINLFVLSNNILMWIETRILRSERINRFIKRDIKPPNLIYQTIDNRK